MRHKERYPENWNDTIRPAVLKRDNYECQICKVKHRSYNQIKSERIFLQCAHRNRVEKDCSMDNLFSLCPNCHLGYDREDNKLRRLTKFK